MKSALSGLRVIDLGRVWSGPLTTRILADFGAEVIKVESRAGRGAFSGPAARQNSLQEDFPDRQPGEHPWNRIGMFNDLNRNKKSLTLDLSTPAGAEVFKLLVKVSDIVVDNYTPRVMSNFKLDYAVLREVKPDIIMLSMPAYGMQGPYREFPGYGNTIEPVAGLTFLTGYLDGDPQPLGMIAGDVLAALHGVSAIMTALWHRQHSGRGQYIDLSQAETQTSVIGEHLLEYQLAGKLPPRRGNRHAIFAPHGCYPCSGQDEWIVITIADDLSWRKLCNLMGQPGPAEDGRFADQFSRWQNAAELDGIIKQFTRQYEKWDLTSKLQSAGITAAPVLNGRDLLADPHLRERGFMIDIPHPEVGVRSYAGVPVKLSKSPASFRLPAPLLGEHNLEVLSGLPGIDDAKISRLQQDGIIGDKPPDVT